MGSFSWLYANTGNQRPLNGGNVGFLYAPDGAIIKEPCYDGYGEFGGNDVYDLVADWNREFLSQHPEYLIYGERGKKPMRVDSFSWYDAYKDLSLSRQKVVWEWKTQLGTKYAEYRLIGIDIACGYARNAWLPFPIKIASHDHVNGGYAAMPPSMDDPNQGFGGKYSVKNLRDTFQPLKPVSFPKEEKRYTFVMYDSYLPFVKGLPGLPCHDGKAIYAVTNDDLAGVISGMDEKMLHEKNVCAIRDNLTKVALTIDSDVLSGDTAAEFLLAFLINANDEKIGKKIGAALDSARRKYGNGVDVVSICIDDLDW